MLKEINKMSSVIPSNIHLFRGDENRSTDEFIEQVAVFRNKVRQLIPHGKVARVLLFESNIFSFLVRFIALGQEGHTIVLPPNDQQGTIEELAENVDFYAGSIVISHLVSLDESDTVIQCDEAFFWPTNGRVIFYTSGSSSRAKAIVKDWCLLNNEVDVLRGVFKCKPQSTFISTVSHQHIYGLLFRALLPLKLGASIFNTFEYPEHIVDVMDKCCDAILISSPAFLSRLSKDNVLSQFKEHFTYIFSSGGPLQDASAMTLCQQFSTGIIQVYGSTETGGIAYRQLIKKEDVLWHFFPGVSCVSTDGDNRLQLFSPFIHQSSMILDDKGIVIDGKLKLLGRIDRTIKLEEKRVNLSQIELKCLEHSWVEEVRLIVLSGDRQILAAIVKLNAFGNEALKDAGKRRINQSIKEHLLTHFELVTLPRKWRYVDELPYNSQGKLPVMELEKLFD